MSKILRQAYFHARDYLESLETRRVAPSEKDLGYLSQFDYSFNSMGDSPERVLEMLVESAERGTVASAGPRYFGFVTGGVRPIALAANWLTSTWDQNSALYTMSPTAAVLEERALDWCLDALRLPPEAAGTLTTGATMANFTCLAAARHAVLKQVGWDVERDGLFGAPPITVIVGEEAHVTLYKSLSMLGLGGARVVKVPVDWQGRMRADAFPEFEAPAIVCLQAGNVNSGAFDPARAIIEKCAAAWVHVDGAFGLWDRAREKSSLSDGYELADSWATDAHKWLNVGYDCGIALVRERESLRRAMAMSADYLPETEHREGMHYSPESSRRARGIELWATMAELGRDRLAEMLERCCSLAKLFETYLRDSGYEILNEVTLNQVLVSFGSDEKTREVIAKVQAEGVCWMGGTVWHGRAAMRISVSNWSTTERDVAKSVASIWTAVG